MVLRCERCVHAARMQMTLRRWSEEQHEPVYGWPVRAHSSIATMHHLPLKLRVPRIPCRVARRQHSCCQLRIAAAQSIKMLSSGTMATISQQPLKRLLCRYESCPRNSRVMHSCSTRALLLRWRLIRLCSCKPSGSPRKHQFANFSRCTASTSATTTGQVLPTMLENHTLTHQHCRNCCC